MAEINQDIIETLMTRVRAAAQGRSKEVRLTMSEAQELVTTIGQVLVRYNRLLEKAVDDGGRFEAKMDGGSF